MLLQPGNVMVVEKALTESEDNEADLRTCQLRGWVDIAYDAVPNAKIPANGNLHQALAAARPAPVYRLTEGGWAVINRSHNWVVAAALLSLVSAVLSVGDLIDQADGEGKSMLLDSYAAER